MRQNEDLPESHCPSCAHYLDQASDPLDPAVRPVPFDLTVCLYCGATLEFDLDMKLQLADEGSLSEPEKAHLAHIRQALREMGPWPSARQSRN